MSKRAILGLSAGACGLVYGAAVVALSPWRQALDGLRTMRSLGASLDAAMDAIAAETEAEIAGRILEDQRRQQ